MSQSSQDVFNEEHTILKIKQYDDEINRLEEQLGIRRSERSRLKTQLDLYRASIAPIKRLSEDVLVLVFSEIIVDSPMAVGRLLFVCRAWYQLVTSQPTLWSRIESAPSGDMKHVKWLTSYVKSAVRYSANMPLDITLNLLSVGLQRLWMHNAAVLAKQGHAPGYSDEGGTSERSKISMWAQGSDAARRFPLIEHYSRLLEQHLAFLTGKTGEVACRWRSFTLLFEPDVLAALDRSLITFLHRPTPLLESLVLEIPWKPVPVWFHPILPITPRLRSVRWQSTPNMNLATLISCKSQVANLQICDIVPQDGLSYTTLFENIQTLFLHFGASYAPLSFNSDTTPLTYPQLKDLTICGRIPRFVADGLDAPQLHTLRLLNQESVVAVLASSFRGSRLHTLFLYAAVPDIVGVCKTFVSRFKNIQEFDLVHHQDKVVEAGLREMKHNGFPATRGYYLQCIERDMKGPKREIFID